MVFGTFDIIHLGHHFFLEKSKAMGDELIVVIGLDETVKKVKGKDPKNSQDIRKKEIEKLDFVDRAVLGKKDDHYRIIEEIKPDIICLGYDQDSFTENLPGEMLRRDIKAKIVRLPPFNEDKYKSSLL